MSKKIILALALLSVVGCLASYRLGIKVAQEATGNAVSAVQTMLAFDHMRRYEEVNSCLKSGNLSGARERLEHSVITQRELVAALLKTVSSPQVLSYIEARTDQTVVSLRNYESGRGTRWVEPACR